MRNVRLFFINGYKSLLDAKGKSRNGSPPVRPNDSKDSSGHDHGGSSKSSIN